MTDLYLNKTELLKRWMQTRGFFSSVDLTRYGLDNQYLRAPRTAREFVHLGEIRRLSNSEAIFRGLVKKGNKPLAWYEWTGEPPRTAQEQMRADNHLLVETSINLQAVA